MADHSAFYPMIAPDVLGCPSITIDSAINRAAIEFCGKALVWQDALTVVVLSPGVWSYALTLPAQSQLVVLQSVKLGTRELAAVADARGQIPWGEADGEPMRYALLADFGQILVDPAPLEASSLTLRAALAPKLTATSLPDLLADRHFEAIAAGAKAILMRMPEKSWTNFQASQFYEGEFKERTSKARIEAEYGRVVGSLSATPRRFGG